MDVVPGACRHSMYILLVVGNCVNCNCILLIYFPICIFFAERKKKKKLKMVITNNERNVQWIEGGVNLESNLQRFFLRSLLFSCNGHGKLPCFFFILLPIKTRQIYQLSKMKCPFFCVHKKMIFLLQTII